MDTVRRIGKYIAIVSCIIAIAHGIIYRKYFAPFEVSVACWIGVFIWIIGYIGVKIQKRRASGSPKKAAGK